VDSVSSDNVIMDHFRLHSEYPHVHVSERVLLLKLELMELTKTFQMYLRLQGRIPVRYDHPTISNKYKWG
jgi:hypothetical protein